MKNKNPIFAMILLFGIFVFIQSNFAVGEVSYCAEKTTSGAWCQNVPFEEVDINFRSAPTSCDATSYCKLGTCSNSQEGTCLENTPQKVCTDPEDGISGGVWFDSELDEVPQCSLGCCLLGDQASFVTQVRCIQLSSLYGLETNYRTDIQSEVACISAATSGLKGACVFEKDFERTCRFSTQEECTNLEVEGSSNVEFNEGLLCSAEELATNCGPSEQTTLIEGKDEVFFVDTCGNLGNIYDSSKINNQNYWRDVIGKAESCGFGGGNAGSATCGNCDYFLGSTGKAYDRTIDPSSPRFGENICRDLGCRYEEVDYQHGETWCSVSSDDEENLPGSRYFRLVCYNGEVSVEACADFRREICIQDELNGFKTAACRVNMWQDCLSQDEERDCENTDQRDCKWVGTNNRDSENKEIFICVPKFKPGFDFWEAESDAESLCRVVNNECIVRYEKGFFDDDYECVENCECLGDRWAEEQNNLCVQLGDCGSIVNYIGSEGYYASNDSTTITGVN